MHTFLEGKSRSALWSKCDANFEKVPKCATGAKRLRTTGLNRRWENWCSDKSGHCKNQHNKHRINKYSCIYFQDINLWSHHDFANKKSF